MGVHAIDGMIDLCGPIAQVYCQSFRRVVPVDSDDTTSMLFRMQDGDVGLPGHDDGDGPGLQLPGVRVEGLGAARRDDARGGRLVRGTADAVVRDGQVSTDQGRGAWCGRRPGSTSRARASRRFAQAAAGGAPFPIPLDEMIHGAAVTEAVVRSAASGNVEKV